MQKTGYKKGYKISKKGYKIQALTYFKGYRLQNKAEGYKIFVTCKVQIFSGVSGKVTKLQKIPPLLYYKESNINVSAYAHKYTRKHAYTHV